MFCSRDIDYQIGLPDLIGQERILAVNLKVYVIHEEKTFVSFEFNNFFILKFFKGTKPPPNQPTRLSKSEHEWVHLATPKQQ